MVLAQMIYLIEKYIHNLKVKSCSTIHIFQVMRLYTSKKIHPKL